MRFGRTLPPAASPIPLVDVFRALPSCLFTDTLDERFAKEIRQEFGSKYCFLVSSGRVALTLSLLALKEIYPGLDQVLLPAFTCYSVPAAIKRAGLRVKLCDLAPSSLDFDKRHLQEIIWSDRSKPKILCVLVPHLFGCPADLVGIRAIVGPGIPVIEDAAQGMGETFNNKKLGTSGDIGFFSLGRGKALSTMEGGVIVTDRDDFANIIKVLIAPLTGHRILDSLSLGVKTLMVAILQQPSLFWLPKALPFLRLGETLYDPDFALHRLPYFQVKLAVNWRHRLEHHRQARRMNIHYWQQNLPAGYMLVCRHKDISLIRLPILAQTKEQRDNILNQGEHQGLGIMPAYPTPINKITALEDDFLGQDYLQADEICNRLLTIPVHEYVQDRDNELILALLHDCQEKPSR